MQPIVKTVHKPDHISVLVPTRSRIQGLEKMLSSLAGTAMDKSMLDVWIYVDSDDQETRNFLSSNRLNDLEIEIHAMVGERPLSQGEICNHLCRQADTGGGIYFSTCDDYRFVTPGWDRVVREGFKRYPDNVLMAFPKDPTAAPGQATHMILGAQWVNGLGRFLTEFFPFWYDDAWIDDVASLIGRKVQLDFTMEPQGGKGKTPRMRNLIFWEKFYLDTLDDRVADAKSLLAKINSSQVTDFPESGSRADKILIKLAQRRGRVDVQKLKNIESQLSDQGCFWNRLQPDHLPLANYLILENRAVTHLLAKVNPLMAEGQYEKVLFLFNTLSHATRPYKTVQSLNDFVQKMNQTGHGLNEPPHQGQPSPAGAASQNGGADRLDRIIAPEIVNDGLFRAIKRIAAQDDVRTALEIGSSDGTGSTQAFLAGLADKSDVARLYCMEMSEGRYQKLQAGVKDDGHVHCVNTSSVAGKRFPTADEITAFYHQHRSALNAYPLGQVLQWLQDDLTYMKERQKDEDGIRRIKAENGITDFDMVLIDGSEFSGPAELDDVYGARYILLDDTRGFKNHHNFHRLRDDPQYELIEEDHTLRNGYAVFRKQARMLPIHFFTIVLNGEPFIEYHLNIFRRLPFEWHWHVIEGVADLKHDTAWSKESGGSIDPRFHKEGLSVDDTRAYLDRIAAAYPRQVTLYRKSKGQFWDGKREMVDAPLRNLPEQCLLWQVDADEIWTLDQVRKTHELFRRHPEKTAAFFHCHFHVGPGLITITPGAYSHHDQYEWLRVWNYRRGMQWKSHEPPCLMIHADGQWKDSAHIAPFTHRETEAAGLVFTHHAYSLESQVRFKESYYGYKDAVANWRRLQQAESLPVRVGDYLPWVKDHCCAHRTDRPTMGKGVPPVPLEKLVNIGAPKEHAGPSPHILIDGVIFQLQARRPQGISRVWSNLISELARQMPRATVTVLEREGFPVPCSHLPVKTVPAFAWDTPVLLDKDDEMLRSVCRELAADLFVSTYFTRAPGVTNLVMMHDMIPEKLGFQLHQPEWVAKQRAIETADAFICVSQTTQSDLAAAYPHVAKRPMAVAYNGLDPCFQPPSREAVEALRQRLNLQAPYVMLVGNRHGYKNGVKVLSSLSRIDPKERPAVLCVGGESQRLPDEERLTQKLDIRWIGSLDDASLAAAYGGAQALLIGSQYEGFGLPVIEAMACGCPVIAHPCAAVQEVGGEAVAYVDMDAPESLPKVLKDFEEKGYRQACIEKGKARSDRFQWPATARIMSDFMQCLIDRPAILLTAVVSTYNSAAFMEGCLDDLVHQTLAHQLEIIVVDSASLQDEATIVRRFQARHGNIKYLRTPERESVYQAWNRGIKFAAGKYITNANTDDRHRRDAFEVMTHVLEDNESIALVYADAVKTNTANETFQDCTPTGFLRWPEWDRTALLEKGCFVGPQPVWRRNVHATYGYFNERYRISADYEFWLRISQSLDFRHIPQTLGLYMERGESIEHADTAQKKREDHEIISTYARAAAQGRIIGQTGFALPDVGQHTPGNIHHQKSNHPTIQDHAVQDGAIKGDTPMYSQKTILKAIEDMVGSDQKEAACWAMDKLLADDPHNAQLHCQRAAMAYDQEDMDTAGQHFETAASLASQSAPIQRQAGDFFFVVEKDAAKALSHYEKALAQAPDDVETLMLAGHLCISLHRYPQAGQYYTQASRIDPDNREARQFLDKLNHQPTAPQSENLSVDELYTQAHEKVQSQDRQSAIALLNQLLKVKPDHGVSHNDLGVLYYETGDMENARVHYERACQLAPEDETFQKNLADFYWVVLADASLAMQQYVQVLKLNPQDVDALLSCAQICLALDQKGDAREFLDAVVTLEPWNDHAKQMQQQLEEKADAVQPAPSAEDLYQQAKDKAAGGDIHTAIDLMNRILEIAPHQSQFYNDLGVLYYEAGEKEKALAGYERAVQLAPSEANYAKNLADFYLVEQGRTEEAMKLYLGILEDNPQDVEALSATALVCASIGHRDDARHFYGRVLEIEPWNQTAMDALAQLENSDSAGENPKGKAAASG